MKTKIHAADVVQTVTWFIENGMHNVLSDLEKFALVIAAAVHDVDHPGRSNNFMIETSCVHFSFFFFFPPDFFF